MVSLIIAVLKFHSACDGQTDSSACFATTYTIGSEMAITDRYDNNVVKIPRNERIRSTDVIAEKVEHFLDPDFWGEYNVIEPNQEIMDAVKRLSGKLRRRAE